MAPDAEEFRPLRSPVTGRPSAVFFTSEDHERCPESDERGDERRQAKPPVDWQQVTLWGVLVLGVALVAVLALRVLRDPAPRA